MGLTPGQIRGDQELQFGPSLLQTGANGNSVIQVPSAIGVMTQSATSVNSGPLTPGSDHVISFDTVLTDLAGYYSAGSPSKLTVPAGIPNMLFVVNCFGTTDQPSIIQIRKNGNLFVSITQTNIYELSFNTSATLQMLAGDYVEVTVRPINNPVNLIPECIFAIQAIQIVANIIIV